MRAINRKLLRDLWHLRGQAAAIALVIACGVATFAMSLSTLDALQAARANFYRDYRFAEVFASLKRAPERLATRIREIPGVDQVETRVVAVASLDVPGFPEPVQGQLISIPDDGQPLMNRLYLDQGRLPAPYQCDEVVISDGFAEAHGIGPGDVLAAVINGRRKRLSIVGVARSPEYIYQLAPGAVIPDFERFGIVWMRRHRVDEAHSARCGVQHGGGLQRYHAHARAPRTSRGGDQLARRAPGSLRRPWRLRTRGSAVARFPLRVCS